MKLTQEEVARELNIHRDTVRNIENGTSSLNAEYIPILAKLYETTESEILKIYLKERGELHEQRA